MYLYKIESTDVKNMPLDSSDEIDLRVFTPSLRGFFLKGEKTGIKKACTRLLFWVMTLGKAQIYYVQNGNTIAHTSYVIPRCIKFPFMEEADLEIGPCYTYTQFRGLGIYPKVLKEICRRKGSTVAAFYMIVDEKNLPSIKGIEKAGFVRCGSVSKNKFTKQYKLVQ